MAISPAKFAPAFISNLTAAGMAGLSSQQLGSALATGLSNYLLTGCKVVSNDKGTLGVGTGRVIPGTTILPLPSIQSSLTANLAASSILGISNINIINAISNASVTCLAFAQANTISSTVGVGAGKGTIAVSSAIPFFSSAFAAVGLSGVSMASLMTAISTSYDTALPTTIIPIIISGPISSIPSTGLGGGTLL